MKNLFINDLFNCLERIENIEKFVNLIKKYKIHLSTISELLYSKLENDDKERFIIWFLKRWGHINLVDKNEYESYLKVANMVNNQICNKISINNKNYKLLDMDIQGYKFKLATYDWSLCIHDVYYNQYEHKSFKVEQNDIIIDAGAFTGDTAALFCEKTSNNCFIHAFELLDENIQLFKYNNKLNNIESFVKINQLALTNKSDKIIKINQTKIEGSTSIFGNIDSEIEIKTITIDDYIENNQIKKIDLIKMDIEGAELLALEGTINTIKKFHPKLALCLYHKWDDVVTIPEFLANLDLNYKYYFKWVHLSLGTEAVLLAEPIKG